MLHIEGVAPLLGQTTFLWKVYTLAMTPKWATTAYLAMEPKLQAIARLPTTQSSPSSVIQKANTRVGTAAYITAGTTFARDIPPYIVTGGNPIAYDSVNTSICRELGISEKVIKHIANAYRLVFHGQTSVFDACIQVNDQVPDSPEIRNIVEFIQKTEQGIICKL